MERRELTPEFRQKLAGFLPFGNDASIEYTPESFLQKDEQGAYLIPDGYRPIFILTCMSKANHDKALNIQLEIGKGSNFYQKQIQVRDIVRESVIGWKDYVDIGTMAEIEYTGNLESFGKIPFPLCIELFTFLLRISGLMPGEKLGLK